MSYSVKKSGIPFIPKVDVNPDAGAVAANFSLSYVDDTAPGTLINVPGVFVEGANTGTFFAPSTTVPAAGDYTFTISNTVDGFGNVSTPVIVTNATIDDINTAIAAAQGDITAIKAVTDLLNTTELASIGTQVTNLQTSVDAMDLLINNPDAAVNSVMEFVTAINTALTTGGNSLSVLGGYTDNLELMLEGKAYTDTTGAAVTAANSYGLAEIFAEIAADGTLTRTEVATANTALTNLSTQITAFQTSVEAKVDAVKVVVDSNATAIAANATALANNATAIATNGTDIATANTALTTLTTNLAAVKTDTAATLVALADATSGLPAIQSLIVTRFDTVDAKLVLMDGKLDSIGTSKRAVAFV